MSVVIRAIITLCAVALLPYLAVILSQVAALITQPSIRETFFFFEPLGLLVPAAYGIWLSSIKLSLYGLAASIALFFGTKVVVFFVSHMDSQIYNFDIDPLVQLLVAAGMVLVAAVGIKIMRSTPTAEQFN